MNKKLVIPFLIWIMFMVTDVASLIKGITHHESWRIACAGIAMILAAAAVFIIIRHTAKELKAVRVRK